MRRVFRSLPLSLARLAGFGLLAASLLLAACGGGGGGVGAGGTGGFAAGPITGFGSVIVGGVRFDDASAAIEDGDGRARTREDLQLGMTVEVTSDTISGSPGAERAVASRIRLDSELRGPAQGIAPNLGLFFVLGQRVEVDSTTAFDARLGALAQLTAGAFVEVFAVYDAAQGRYRAKRVAAADPADGARLRGPVNAFDAAAQTLRIGSVSYSFAGASGVPASLAPGQFVRLRVGTSLGPGGRWPVLAFGATALPPLPELEGGRISGLVTSFGSLASFAVGGREVDASGAGFGGTLAVGDRVEVRGRIERGVLRASRLQVESDDDDRRREFEFAGPITSADAGAQTFVLRGQIISTVRPDLRYENGGPGNLLPGRRVEVRGLLAADRLRVEATRIRFE